MVLPTVSAPRTSRAPIIQEQGKRTLWSAPIIILVMWGATRQMKPIIPVKQVMAAVIRVASIMDTTLTCLALTPRLVAVSSPAARAFKSHEYFINKGKQARKKINTTGKFF